MNQLTQYSLRRDWFPGAQWLALTFSIDSNDLHHVLAVWHQTCQGHLWLQCLLDNGEGGSRDDTHLDDVVGDGGAAVAVWWAPGNIS